MILRLLQIAHNALITKNYLSLKKIVKGLQSRSNGVEIILAASYVLYTALKPAASMLQVRADYGLRQRGVLAELRNGNKLSRLLPQTQGLGRSLLGDRPHEDKPLSKPGVRPLSLLLALEDPYKQHETHYRSLQRRYKISLEYYQNL